MDDKYAVLYAPDGLHFQKMSEGVLPEMWNFFTQNADIREQLALNKSAKFRLINSSSRAVIGELPHPTPQATGTQAKARE